jgi:hypothetical protein
MIKMAGQQGIFTPPRYQALVSRKNLKLKPCLRLQIVCLMICFIFFVRLLFSHWLWQRYSSIPNFDVTNTIPILMHQMRISTKVHGGRDRSAEDVYSSMAPDPTFAFVGGTCYLTRFCICPLDYDYDLHIVNFAVLYCIVSELSKFEKTSHLHFFEEPMSDLIFRALTSVFSVIYDLWEWFMFFIKVCFISDSESAPSLSYFDSCILGKCILCLTI